MLVISMKYKPFLKDPPCAYLFNFSASDFARSRACSTKQIRKNIERCGSSKDFH